MLKYTNYDIKEYLHYCPETGVFTWIKSPKSTIKIGTFAGSFNRYRTIKFKGIRYYAHQLAFYFMTGKIEKGIDHIDGNPDNNKWNNLRICSQSHNSFNKKKTIKTKNIHLPRGVTIHHTGKYQAHCMKNKKAYYLGLYDTIEEAHKAYVSKVNELYGENFNTKVYEL